MIIDWLGQAPEYFAGGFAVPWGSGGSVTGAGNEVRRVKAHIRRTVRWRFNL
jgi:hypothetical protein